MTNNQNSEVIRLQHWIDLFIKAAIMCAISIGTWQVKRISDDVESTKIRVSLHDSEIMVLQSQFSQTTKLLERIETKVDNLLQEKREITWQKK